MSNERTERHAFLAAAVAAVQAINPVAGNPTSQESVNGGHYTGHVNTLGVGASYKL